MLRLLLVILLFISSPAWAVTQWNKSLPLTGDNLTAWPAAVTAQWAILETLLSNYRRGEAIVYKNSTTLTVMAGEITASNSGSSLRIFLQDSGNTDITSSNLDTGSSFNNSTTYYVYAGATSSTAVSSTYYISLSSSAPSGPTYYVQLGNFTTDGSGNVTPVIFNNNLQVTGFGAPSSKSPGVAYFATTDGLVSIGADIVGNASQYFTILSDSSPTPGTEVGGMLSGSGTTQFSGIFMYRVVKGNYWEVNSAGGSVSGVTWTSLGS